MFFTKRLQTNTMPQFFYRPDGREIKKKKSWISRAKRDQYATTFYRPNGREIKKNKKVLDFSREAR